MINLYDEEIVAVYRIGEALQRRFGRRTWTGTAGFERLASELEQEAAEAYSGIGLIVSTDVSPMLAGRPPSISVVGRADPGFEFDHDRKAHEVRRAAERGEAVFGESG